MSQVTTSLGRAAWLVLERDLRLALRRWEQITHPVAFFLMIASLFPLALSPEPSQLRNISPCVVWVGALLSSLLALESLYRSDQDDGTLEQMTLSGQPLPVLLFAKTIAHWLLSGIPLVVAAPLVGLWMGAPERTFGVMMLSVALGTGVLSFLGSVAAALTLGTRRGSVLLSLLVLPLALPVLIFGAKATDLAMHGESSSGAVLLLAAVLILTVTLAPWASAAAVRISLE
jgi:heme exporter protein B